jgi:hypothetical protein
LIFALAAVVLLGQAEPPDCRRVRSDPELQPCEIERGEHDVLDSAKRPPAAALGKDAIRFSMQQSLGGRGVVVELVGGGDRPAAVRLFWFDGHPRLGWTRKGAAEFSLTRVRHARLSRLVDGLLTSYRSHGGEDVIVCMDGPEQVTERVRAGKVVTLSGFCPATEKERHPNEGIAAAMLSLACPYMLHAGPRDRNLRRDCRRWGAYARREGGPF